MSLGGREIPSFSYTFIDSTFTGKDSPAQPLMHAVMIRGADGISPLQILVDGKHWEALRAILDPRFFALESMSRYYFPATEFWRSLSLLYDAITQMLKDHELDSPVPASSALEWVAAGGFPDLTESIKERGSDNEVLPRHSIKHTKRIQTFKLMILSTAQAGLL